MAWDTFSRRRIDLIGRKDDGDQVIAHEFDFSVPNQVIYSHNGAVIKSTPVSHYQTEGPVALRLDWNGLSVTYSGKARAPYNTGRDLYKHCWTAKPFLHAEISGALCSAAIVTMLLPVLHACKTCQHV